MLKPRTQCLAEEHGGLPTGQDKNKACCCVLKGESCCPADIQSTANPSLIFLPKHISHRADSPKQLSKGWLKKTAISDIPNVQYTIPQTTFISHPVHHFLCYNLSNLCFTQTLWRIMWNIYDCQEKFGRHVLQVPQYDLYSGNLPFSLELC